jgi:hypothetical protein
MPPSCLPPEADQSLMCLHSTKPTIQRQHKSWILELEDLLGRDDAFLRRDRRGEAVEQPHLSEET